MVRSVRRGRLRRGSARVLAGGKSLATDEPYAQLLHNPETKKVGGSAHVVEWSAEEANGAAQIITMLQTDDLPGLF